MIDFEKIAPYLQDPLVLIGFVVFLFLSFARYLVKQGIFPNSTKWTSWLAKAYGPSALQLHSLGPKTRSQ